MVYLLEYDTVGMIQDRQAERKRGRELLRFGLDRQYGLRAVVRQESGEKPYLEGVSGIYFNISHTKGLVACGIEEQEIGIDVEWIRPYDRRLMRRICTEEEIAYIEDGNRVGEQIKNERFFRLWTLKESYLKATGQGLAVPMKEISFIMEENNREQISSNLPGWTFRQFRYAGRYLVSLCRRCKETAEGTNQQRKSMDGHVEIGGNEAMTYEEIFEKVKKLFEQADVSEVKEHLAYQFNIVGEGEGAFYAEIQDGKLDIQPYEYYDRDAVFICKAEVLFGMISGEIDPIKAFTVGKLKVDGSIDKALKLKDFVKKK